jgi:hypothetical protein
MQQAALASWQLSAAAVARASRNTASLQPARSCSQRHKHDTIQTSCVDMLFIHSISALETFCQQLTTLARVFFAAGIRSNMARLQVAAIAIALFGLLAVASAGMSTAVLLLFGLDANLPKKSATACTTALPSKQHVLVCLCPTHFHSNQ